MADDIAETWWLDASALPDLLWARLRVFADRSAEVFDLDGRYTRFPSETEARNFLLEDEYARHDELDLSDLASLGLAPGGLVPPVAADDRELTGRMLVRRP